MIASRVLNVVARGMLRARSPRAARRVVFSLGRWLPRLSIADAQRALSALEAARRGSCLSRSLAIAARVPGAVVVIGVRGPSSRFGAHAWVEVGGVALLHDPIREKSTELARLASSGAPRAVPPGGMKSVACYEHDVFLNKVRIHE